MTPARLENDYKRQNETPMSRMVPVLGFVGISHCGTQCKMQPGAGFSVSSGFGGGGVLVG